MILLDTNAVIWLAQGHRRAKPLARLGRLHLSPASLLELQFLVEIGRLRFVPGLTASTLAEDLRWRLDEPPAARWFEVATELRWTRDPFDRLIAAHAIARGWQLATADDHLLDHLPARHALPL